MDGGVALFSVFRMARPPIETDYHDGRPEPSPTQTGQCLILVEFDLDAVSFLGDSKGLGLVPEGAQSPLAIESLPPTLGHLIRSLQANPRPIRGQSLPWTFPDGPESCLLVDALPETGATASTRTCALLLHRSPWIARAPRPTLDFPLFSAMAHEIKNSLVAIKTMVELLLEKDPKLEMARIVRQEVDRIVTIVGQMLSSSAPTETRASDVSLHAIIEAVSQILRPQAQARSISLQLNLRASQDLIHADPRQIEQAILNVAMNGMEAIEGSGTLTLSTEIREAPMALEATRAGHFRRVLVVVVRDSGSGIPPTALDRLYEDFFTTKSRGSGLGLSITRRVMQSHGGSILANSSVGQGTVFELSFPLLPEVSQ